MLVDDVFDFGGIVRRVGRDWAAVRGIISGDEIDGRIGGDEDDGR